MFYDLNLFLFRRFKNLHNIRYENIKFKNYVIITLTNIKTKHNNMIININIIWIIYVFSYSHKCGFQTKINII